MDKSVTDVKSALPQAWLGTGFDDVHATILRESSNESYPHFFNLFRIVVATTIVS